MIRISSRDNPALKQLRSLQEKKYRQQYGLFMIEGRKLVKEALASGIVRQVFVDEDSADAWAAERAGYPESDWYELDRRLSAAAGNTVHPQGIAAAAVLPDLSLAVIMGQKPQWMLYLDHINDPGNLGSMLRSAWALGVEAVLLSPECADPFNPKAVRAASGAVLHLPVAQTAGAADLQSLIADGCQLIGADAEAEVPYYQVEFRRPAILAIGSEARGLSPEIRCLCTELAGIPMPAGVESLNAAAAAAVILADYARRYIGHQS